MSHIKQMVSIQTVTRAKVITLLGITEERYGTFLMECALEYLDGHLEGCVIGKELAKNSLFWAWWRNHWHDRDMEFVEECKKMSQRERNMYYEIIHNPQSFTFTPQKSVLLSALTPQPLIKHQL